MKMNQIKKLTVFFLMLSMSGANALAFEMQDMDMDKENSSAEYMQDTSNIDLDGCHFIQPLAEVAYKTTQNEEAIEDKYGITIDEISTQSNLCIVDENNDNQLSFNMSELKRDSMDQSSDALSDDMRKPYNAQGYMIVNGIKDKFSLNGILYQIDLDNGEIAYAGGLYGYLNGDDTSNENLATMSFRYNPSTNDQYINMSVGSALSLDFGTSFETLTELGEKVYSQIQSNAQNCKEIKDVAVSGYSSTDEISRCDTEYGTWRGYRVAFCSLWGESTANYSGNFNFLTKAQGNLYNFAKASRSGLPETGTPDTIVNTENHTLECATNINNSGNSKIRCNSLLPKERSSTIGFTIPVETPIAAVNELLGYFTDISITLNEIEHVYENNYQKTTVEAYSYDFAELDSSSRTNPYNEESGFTSQANYYNGLSSGSSDTFYARSEITYFYQNIRADGNIVPAWKTVATDTIGHRISSY